MMATRIAFLLLGLCGLSTALAASPPSPQPQASLSARQQQAVDLQLATPQAAQSRRSQAAYGLVLDAAAFVADNNQLSAAQHSAQLAQTELNRLRALHDSEGDASLRAVQQAEAAAALARGEAQTQLAGFTQRWGPLAARSSAQRAQLAAELLGARSVLIRAELPGSGLPGALPRGASVQLDGLNLPAQVLGHLPQAQSALRGAGLLLMLGHAPLPLAAGTRVAVQLQAAGEAALLVPGEALIFEAGGSYVYRQLLQRDAQQRAQYAAVPVRVLGAEDGLWRVQGLKASDRIVVRGAGVLWSLQGLSGVQAEDDDD